MFDSEPFKIIEKTVKYQHVEVDPSKTIEQLINMFDSDPLKTIEKLMKNQQCSSPTPQKPMKNEAEKGTVKRPSYSDFGSSWVAFWPHICFYLNKF